MRYMLGVDEAGRGPLAGPVAVGVVMVPEAMLPKLRKMFPGVNDSKQLSEGKREEIFALMKAAVAEGVDDASSALRAPAGGFRFCVRLRSAAAIDARGIVPAVRSALDAGVRHLAPDHTKVRVLLDGALRAPSEYPQRTIIGGDATEAIISLASIAAKVTRDRLMVRLAKQYPAYGFERHKGYGTAFHYEMLAQHGSCVVHRRSFLPLELRGAAE